MARDDSCRVVDRRVAGGLGDAAAVQVTGGKQCVTRIVGIGSAYRNGHDPRGVASLLRCPSHPGGRLRSTMMSSVDR